jgi:hypothetical protein
MAVVPYTFADQAGQIPLSELDVNFANVKAFAETAGNVTGNVQANITAVGTLATLSVTGNIVAARLIGNVIGNVTGNVSGTITAPGLNTQVLFNDNGVVNATSGMTFNKVTSNFFVGNTITSLISSSALTIANNINVTDVVRAGTVLANSGIVGVPPGTSTLFLGNTICTTVRFGGDASNIHIANVNSTTRIAGNVSAGGNVAAAGSITATGNITGGNVSATNLTGSLTTAAQANITSVGTLTSLSVTGNIATAGQISASGNITGGNIIGTIVGTVSTTSVSASGNIDGGNLRTAGQISASGNITGGNIIGTIVGTVSTTSVSASGNIDGGNLRTTGSVLATGNIQGGNITTAGAVSLSGNLSAGGNTVLSGNATAATAANGTSTTQIATTAFVVNAITNSAIPAGVILLWSGSIINIPAGWALCNGASGTPDLRNRFIVGAGSTYAVNAVGGSANAVVVDHTHTATSVVTDLGHNHADGAFNRLLQVTNTQTATSTDFSIGEPNLTSSGNIQANTTGITVATTVNSAGVSGIDANLPPYYALAYIMKL